MKKVIIVGASSGIGAALVPIFISKGFQVGITGRREQLLANIQQMAPQQIHFQCFDVNQTNAINELETLVEKLGGLDVLIYSAGVGDENPNLDFEIENKGIETQVQAFVKIRYLDLQFFQKATTRTFGSN
jgi:short-subunit dehydrogenase